jgi:hypothetical protein
VGSEQDLTLGDRTFHRYARLSGASVPRCESRADAEEGGARGADAHRDCRGDRRQRDDARNRDLCRMVRQYRARIRKVFSVVELCAHDAGDLWSRTDFFQICLGSAAQQSAAYGRTDRPRSCCWLRSRRVQHDSGQRPNLFRRRRDVDIPASGRSLSPTAGPARGDRFIRAPLLARTGNRAGRHRWTRRGSAIGCRASRRAARCSHRRHARGGWHSGERRVDTRSRAPDRRIASHLGPNRRI